MRAGAKIYSNIRQLVPEFLKPTKYNKLIYKIKYGLFVIKLFNLSFTIDNLIYVKTQEFIYYVGLLAFGRMIIKYIQSIALKSPIIVKGFTQVNTH